MCYNFKPRETSTSMKYLLIVFLLLTNFIHMNAKHVPQVYVDKAGVMRWNDSHKEASFYGVNYTLPFAHAYRVIDYFNIDHKAAIDRDVYHISRLGVNAYRIHIWDVEVSDNEGNLINNHHMELLDYLIAQLQERGIYTLITAQTNFGNGYPERNIQTNGFAYLYDKCDIHSNPKAIKAQSKYLNDLVSHVNPYTGKAYKEDPYIVGFEINNEPCHSGTEDDVKSYINQMLSSINATGNTKPIFYNVSHNQYVVAAYYDTPIHGTTYQWYPLGLVGGQTRRGNFLPYIDAYHIPFSHVKGFDTKAKLIYEYDPADNLATYLFPATARTFRKAGFQWVTQFTYDPIDMAYGNTEYQTHYLNLAYTPGKAIGMKIAAEVAQQVKRGQDYGVYPADTLFGDFRVSHNEDLSELNSTTKYFYSNSTSTQPKSANKLVAVAGCGESPLVKYEGTGAYFIDQLDKGVWRLEVMPDAVVVNDPFAKPSLDKEVVRIVNGKWDMILNLPDLGSQFTVSGINKDNHRNTTSIDGTIPTLEPGVYILQSVKSKSKQLWTADKKWNHILLGEYVAPTPSVSTNYAIAHTAATMAEKDEPLFVEATIVGPQMPDSVWIFTDKVSFWNTHNPSYKMNRVKGYTYRAEIPINELQGDNFKYNIIVANDAKMQTFPGNNDMNTLSLGYAQGVIGNPLDWNYTHTSFWTTPLCVAQTPILLFTAANPNDRMDTYCLPKWENVVQQIDATDPMQLPVYKVRFDNNNAENLFVLRKFVGDVVNARHQKTQNAQSLYMRLTSIPTNMNVGFITTNGITYLSNQYIVTNDDCMGVLIEIPLHTLQQTRTALVPYAYPDFLSQWFETKDEVAFNHSDIEFFELNTDSPEININTIWLD